MDTQVTSQLLMVRPANFSSNKETIETNKFQNDITPDLKNNIQAQALSEFDKMVKLLRDHEISVIDIDDIKILNNKAINKNSEIATLACKIKEEKML